MIYNCVKNIPTLQPRSLSIHNFFPPLPLVTPRCIIPSLVMPRFASQNVKASILLSFPRHCEPKAWQSTTHTRHPSSDRTSRGLFQRTHSFVMPRFASQNVKASILLPTLSFPKKGSHQAPLFLSLLQFLSNRRC